MLRTGGGEGHGAVACGRTERLTAAATALFVTFLWSTSWMLIKHSLPVIPPLTFAGLRYAMAFLCPAPFLSNFAAGPAGPHSLVYAASVTRI